MATINSNFFEIQRRGYLWTSISTLDDGNTSLGWDADPNGVIDGNTPGESKLYAVPVHTHYGQSNGIEWRKTTMPNTWVAIPSSTSPLANNMLSGSGIPTLSTVPPTSDPCLYLDFSNVSLLGGGTLWGYESTTGHWYPFKANWLAKVFNETATTAEILAFEIGKTFIDVLTPTDLIEFEISKVFSDAFITDDEITFKLDKVLDDSTNTTEDISFEKVSKYINGYMINGSGIN